MALGDLTLEELEARIKNLPLVHVKGDSFKKTGGRTIYAGWNVEKKCLVFLIVNRKTKEETVTTDINEAVQIFNSI